MSYIMQRIIKLLRNPFVLLMIWPIILVVGIMVIAVPISAQEGNRWSAQKTIPGYHPETETPILIADQNGTVHTFASQTLAEFDGQPLIGVTYNKWASGTGWTMPVDILLSPLKTEARLLDVFLDKSGMMHVIFFGGDNTGANIYYSNAPAVTAGQASAWSKPKVVGSFAHNPENGGIATDGDGNLVVVYSGNRLGTGWYIATSSDNGTTWSEDDLFFPVYDRKLSPFYFQKDLGDSGSLHAVWSIQDKNNHGQSVYYANLDFETMQWDNLVLLAEQTEAGNLGTMAPIIIDHDGSLFVMYYQGSTNHQYFLKSDDGGRNWSDAIAPFPHVGLNGPGHFVVDSNDELHLFWGQRIAGVPDIHGMWHTTWQESGWSKPEAIVSGPRVSDLEGFQAFDPVTPDAAISRGNEVLVTWQSDYGLRGNGVWYSTTVLDAPQLPALPLPTVPSATVVDNSAEKIVELPEPTPQAVVDSSNQFNLPVVVESNPSERIITALVPVSVLILLIVIIRRLSQSRQR